MKIKNKINKVLILILATFLLSCEYNETNDDPTRPSGESVPALAVMPIMQIQSHRNLIANLGRVSGIITQQWTGNDAQQNLFTNYRINENDVNNTWITGIYTGSLRDCVDIIGRIDGPNGLYTRGVAKIYLAINIGLVTNCWGDVPFSEAIQGSDNLFPSYDTQESIYDNIFRLLDEAVVDLTSTDPVGRVQGSLVSLDESQWIKVAYALKARYYLQLSKRDPMAAQKALTEIARAMDSNTDQAVLVFENTLNGGNPLGQFGQDRPNTLIIDPDFATFMTGDPRKDVYMVANGDDFRYFELGSTDLFWARLDSPGVLMTFAEQKFIEAEALERTGADGTAALIAGITANMEYIGISSADIAAYLATVSPLTGTLESDLEAIIIEKYKALYGNSPVEIWNDYRRTGYPNLTPKAEGANNPLNPTGNIPRLFVYPISERIANPDSFEAAVSRRGGNLLSNPSWAFD